MLVMRLRHEPTDAQIDELNERFGHLCKRGDITRVGPLEPERKEADRLDLFRVAFAFAKHGYGELRGNDRHAEQLRADDEVSHRSRPSDHDAARGT